MSLFLLYLFFWLVVLSLSILIQFSPTKLLFSPNPHVEPWGVSLYSLWPLILCSPLPSDFYVCWSIRHSNYFMSNKLFSFLSSSHFCIRLSIMSPLHAASKELWPGGKEDSTLTLLLPLAFYAHSLRHIQRIFIKFLLVQDSERKVGDKRSNKKDVVLASMNFYLFTQKERNRRKKYNRSFHMSVIENHLEAIKRHKLSTCRLENCLQMKFFFFFFDWYISVIYQIHISFLYTSLWVLRIILSKYEKVGSASILYFLLSMVLRPWQSCGFIVYNSRLKATLTHHTLLLLIQQF